MKKTIKAYRADSNEKKILLLNLELDEELERLFNAMQDKNELQIVAAKTRLSELREEMMTLGAF